MPTHAQLDMMQAAFEMLRASENVDAAVEAFTTDLTAEQPACFDPTKNCKIVFVGYGSYIV